MLYVHPCPLRVEQKIKDKQQKKHNKSQQIDATVCALSVHSSDPFGKLIWEFIPVGGFNPSEKS